MKDYKRSTYCFITFLLLCSFTFAQQQKEKSMHTEKEKNVTIEKLKKNEVNASNIEELVIYDEETAPFIDANGKPVFPEGYDKSKDVIIRQKSEKGAPAILIEKEDDGKKNDKTKTHKKKQ
ncbi:hypothetical protein J8281_11345 [Aquimarina sp. U1-2]|uniref:hypothetical protein n=1 Tax=Aquimarina sp. U1-2 TaxID=2823141 RepID=UPI001AECF54F|nr:hypothetical protein [Aquimarina sp. U1-2]MBP2832782.1 hypothetical protein [Aquimarina sp. U1-2]